MRRPAGTLCSHLNACHGEGEVEARPCSTRAHRLVESHDDISRPVLGQLDRVQDNRRRRGDAEQRERAGVSAAACSMGKCPGCCSHTGRNRREPRVGGAVPTPSTEWPKQRRVELRCCCEDVRAALPPSGHGPEVWQQCVAEVVHPHVRVGVGCLGRAQEREREAAAACGVAVLGVGEERGAVVAAGEVAPAQPAHLVLHHVAPRVRVRRARDAAELRLVRGGRRVEGQWEFDLRGRGYNGVRGGPLPSTSPPKHTLSTRWASAQCTVVAKSTRALPPSKMTSCCSHDLPPQPLPPSPAHSDGSVTRSRARSGPASSGSTRTLQASPLPRPAVCSASSAYGIVSQASQKKGTS